jgi:hypothetical protein
MGRARTAARGYVHPYPAVAFSVVAATDVFTVSGGHNLANGDRARVLRSGGSSLPSPLQADRDESFYVISVSGSNFQLSLARNGSPINVTQDGSGLIFKTGGSNS